MCRIFGMSGGPNSVRATFWLLEAPDSLAAQSRHHPDGAGIGSFRPDGSPDVEKDTIPAFRDPDFVREAQEVESHTFIAHVRYASTGSVTMENTHPFEQHGRLFAHHGMLKDLDRLEQELGEYRSLVKGETDSEHFFALITKEIEARDGDVGAGIAAAVQWAASNAALYALNLVLTTPTDLWALRYPDTHELYLLERVIGGPSGNRHLDHASEAGTVRVRSGDLATIASVVVASVRMDEDPGWRLLEPGELLHVDGQLQVSSTVVDHAPKQLLKLADLQPQEAASQMAGAVGSEEIAGRLRLRH
jgi:predicted glutamine amidotransferase